MTEWHRIVADRDAAGLRGILAEDVSLGAPPYWNRFEGVPLVAHLLDMILHTVEEFAYHREWRDGPELALEFRGRVGDLELQGVDLISVDPTGKLRRIDVVIRPANAVAVLTEIVAPRMAEYLARPPEERT